MEHLSLAVAVICALTGSVVLNKLLNLQRIFKTTYLKFYIESMVCMYIYVLATLVFFYQRFHLHFSVILIRQIFLILALPAIILAVYLKVVSLYNLIGLQKRLLMKVFTGFIIVIGISDLHFNLVYAANPDSLDRSLLLWLELCIYLGFMLSKLGLLDGISCLRPVKRKIIMNIVRFYIAIDLIYILFAATEFFFITTRAFFLIQTMSIVILLNLMIIRFSKNIVLNVNDRKTAENGRSNGNEFLFAELSITPREQEIVNLIMKGKSNKDISDQLCISIHTVKDHTRKIYQKTGVSNRVELTNLFS